MSILTQKVKECENLGIIDARRITNTLLEEYASLSKNDVYSLLSDALLPAVRYVQTKQRGIAPIPTRSNNGVYHVSRVTRIRTTWQRQLEAIVYVNQEAKRFGDCTRPDMLWLANSLKTKANEMMEKAAWYMSIADMLHDDMRVRDLPEQNMEDTNE